MNKEKKSLSVFGYGLALILTLFAFKNYLTHQWTLINIILFLTAAFFIFITKVNRGLLKKIYTPWMIGARFIGSVIFGALLSIMFFMIFAPVGIIMKIFKKDILDKKMNSKKDSYWIKRSVESFKKKSYTKQF